jgi:hypothetical protein
MTLSIMTLSTKSLFDTHVQLTRPNKIECFYVAITFQSSIIFAGNTRSLPKKDRAFADHGDPFEPHLAPLSLG